MGDWRTVNIEGAMAPSEAEEMIEMLSQEYCWDTPAACLSIGIGAYGLGQWVKPDGMIRGVGNLAERDYNNSDICEALQYLASKYPSLNLTLHSGSSYQSTVCSATFHVEDGHTKWCAPEVKHIMTAEEKWKGNRAYLGVM